MTFESYAKSRPPKMQTVDGWMRLFKEWAKTRSLNLTESFASSVLQALVVAHETKTTNVIARLAPLAASLEKIGNAPTVAAAASVAAAAVPAPTAAVAVAAAAAATAAGAAAPAAHDGDVLLHAPSDAGGNELPGIIELFAYDIKLGFMTVWHKCTRDEFLEMGEKLHLYLPTAEIAEDVAKQVTHEHVHYRATIEMQRQSKKILTHKENHTHIYMHSIAGTGPFLMTFVAKRVIPADGFTHKVLKLSSEWTIKNGSAKLAEANLAGADAIDKPAAK